MTRRRFVIGNWKMNLGPAAAKQLAEALRVAVAPLEGVAVRVTPPFTSLTAVVEALRGSGIEVGGQNVHYAASGAFTGEIAPAFLREVGCTFSLVGHSERRHGLGESSELVARRALGALEGGLDVVICIGETLEEYKDGRTHRVLTQQLDPVFETIPAEMHTKVTIAYEPVWAIGTGVVAQRTDIDSAHSFLKDLWEKRSGGPCVPLLYGGSVTPGNCPDIFKSPFVDGALVGGASLKVDQFAEIVRVLG